MWREIVRKRRPHRGLDRDTEVAVESRLVGKASERPWLARIALFATLFALLATGPLPSYEYTLASQVAGPTAELTGTTPARRFRLRARARDLAPNGMPTTSSVYVVLSGTIARGGDAPSAPVFVSVSWSDGTSASADGSVSAVTEFSLSRQLAFRGACGAPATAACEAQAIIDFERTDLGAAGGSVRVEWALSLRASVHKDDEPSVELTPPWDLDLTEE
jgi:hypothetical protein